MGMVDLTHSFPLSESFSRLSASRTLSSPGKSGSDESARASSLPGGGRWASSPGWSWTGRVVEGLELLEEEGFLSAASSDWRACSCLNEASM